MRNVFGGVLFAAMAALLPPKASAAQPVERDVNVKTATGVLWGTLEFQGDAPAGPAAIILPGSGPTNRDSNSPNIHPDTLKLLAHDLAARGIATIRIDKRGIGESAPAMKSEADIRFQIYADDAKAWAADLKTLTGAKCVWLVGHSEGALVAEVAAEDDSEICGLALISGAGRKAGDILREQLSKKLQPPLLQQAFDAISELEAGRTVAAPPPQLTALFRPSVQPYLISWLPLDPAAILAKLHSPALILQGDNDIQISTEDAKLLAKARPDAKLVILPGVNHILKIAPADRAGNIATYGDPSLPLAPGVADDIADFIVRK